MLQKTQYIISYCENSNWLSSITKNREIESVSRPPYEFWMSDDKQLEV
jgi:hypothetical protein